MSGDLARRLRDAVADSPLAEALPAAAEDFVERRGGDAACAALSPAALRGLACLLATDPRAGGFLGHRPALLERIAAGGPRTLAERAAEIESTPPRPPDDLEGALDALRLLRREETCLAACLDLGGIVAFEEVSRFLSVVAESILRRALALAERSVGAGTAALAVIGMGKLAGQEFTYHSDLDIVFLYGGDVEAIERESRVAQRLISYLTTMTGAGVAYAVDTRLRPSGRQGTLVTTFEGFERYQCEQADTWEHLAMLRARAVAGDVRPCRALLERVRGAVRGRENPWAGLADLRKRVEAERAASEGIPFKTGAGGLMDVDYLAGGGLLESAEAPFPELPSVPAMLRAAAAGPRAEALLDDYAFLRRVEARARWLAGRPVEILEDDATGLRPVAELVEPGLDGSELARRIAAARASIRAAYDAVIGAGTIAALAR